MSGVTYTLGTVLRETGRALDRLGCTLQGSRVHLEDCAAPQPALAAAGRSDETQAILALLGIEWGQNQAAATRMCSRSDLMQLSFQRETESWLTESQGADTGTFSRLQSGGTSRCRTWAAGDHKWAQGRSWRPVLLSWAT